jgi:hypothetical protein
MIGEQLFLFPEHNYFIQKIKNVDYVDLSDVKDSGFTDKSLSNLEKGRFILWKTGGINPYMKDSGKVFPYIQDIVRKRTKTIRVKIGNDYPRFHVEYWRDNKKIFYKPLIHIVVANAFIKNPLPNKFKLVHHKNNNPLDYRVENLQHYSRSLNSRGSAHSRHGTTHDIYMEKHYTRTTKT